MEGIGEKRTDEGNGGKEKRKERRNKKSERELERREKQMEGVEEKEKRKERRRAVRGNWRGMNKWRKLSKRKKGEEK